jgi:hypothetical protein
METRARCLICQLTRFARDVPPRSMSEDHTHDADALDEGTVGRVDKVEAGSPAPSSGPPPPAPSAPSAKVAADFAQSAAMFKDILSVDSGGESAPTATDVRGDATGAAPSAISEVIDPPGSTSDVPISPDLFPSRPARPIKRFRRPK